MTAPSQPTDLDKALERVNKRLDAGERVYRGDIEPIMRAAKHSKDLEKERDTYFNRLGEHATAIFNLEQQLSTLRTDYKQAQHHKERLLNVLEHCALDPDKQPPEQHLVARMVVKELRHSAIETMKGEV